MSNSPNQNLPTIALISAPWPFFHQPSIQLGVLKAYLKQAMPLLPVAAHHLYLRVAAAIGYERYRRICRRTWLAESVYAALLDPERAGQAARIFKREAGRGTGLGGEDFAAVVAATGAATDAWIESVAWEALRLAGFSLCLCQLTASLYCIRKIKAVAPGLPIVVGGSLFAGESVPQLMRAVPEIDFMVTGEGEKPLLHLVRRLIAGTPDRVSEIAGLVCRNQLAGSLIPAADQLTTLEVLPYPDFDDYFRLLGGLKPEKRFFPTLPAEVSRGCGWQRVAATGGKSGGCAFCNLNRQWRGYRLKRPSQVAREIDYLTNRHRVLSVAFVDNLLPVRQIPEIFGYIRGLKKDLRLFGEIRAVTPLPALEAMRAAGVREVQIGIEALSSRLLEKLNKGTSAIKNLEIMKHCEALGIENRGNLICGFPGSDDADVLETLAALPFAMPFRPLKPVYFWLGVESPIWRSPERFGIRAVANHPYYHALFPSQVVRQVTFPIQSWQGEKRIQRRRWKPVEKALRDWAATYGALHSAPYSPPILGFRDGGDFLIIRQRRLNADPVTHRLEKNARRIYLFCQNTRSLAAITERFPELSPEKVGAFLREMTAKRLMFIENDHCLSLAVPTERCVTAP